MRLGALPAIRVLPGGAEPPRALEAFAAARACTERDVPAAIAASDADAVVVIDMHVVPDPTIEAFSPEPAIWASGLTFAFPVRSVVTGLFVPRGLRVVRPEGGDATSEPAFRLPHSAGHLHGNETPQAAFATAFDLATEARALRKLGNDARCRIALSATLGADALNGDWWRLGALSGLLGRDSRQAAWADAASLLADPEGLWTRLRELARLVRLDAGFPVAALDRQESAAMRTLLPDLPPSEMWWRFVTDVAELGEPGRAVAERYARAARYAWPEDD